MLFLMSLFLFQMLFKAGIANSHASWNYNAKNLLDGAWANHFYFRLDAT
jgi:hypothetical protein